MVKESLDHVLGDHVPPARASRVDFHEVLRILYRNIYLIAASAVLGFAIAAIAIYVIKPIYTSDIAIVFGADERPILDLRAALIGQPQDEAAILSEIDVIKSRTLASRLVTDLNLTEDPEFNEAIREKGLVVSLWQNILPQRYDFTPPPPGGRPGDVNRQKHVDQQVVENVIDRIDARHVPRSRTVTVSFYAHDPEVAASVLNAIADLYLVARLDDQLENAKRAGGWLSEQMGKLKDEVLQAEQAVNSYRNEHRLYRTEEGGILDRQIVDLTLKLNEVAAARRSAEANMADARRLLNSPARAALESSSAILNSPVVQRFREEELALGRKEAELKEELGARHPQMIQLEAEKQALQGTLKIEIQRIVGGLENEVEVAKAQEEAIGRDVAKLKAELKEENRAAVGLQGLERELEARRLLLDRFMAAFGEARAHENFGSQAPDARVVSRAKLPDEPSFPPSKRVLPIALVAFALAGIGLALVREYLDDTFRSAEQVESASGIPVLAHVPLVPTSKTGGEDLSSYLLRHCLSPFFDAVHSVSTSIMFGLGKAPRVVLVSSAVAGEGKTTLALALGRQLSQSGKRVVVIEADFRRPQVAERVKGLAPSPGLREVLAGVAPINGVLQEDPASGMKVIVSGGGGPQPFSSQTLGVLKTVIGELRAEYDLVILDSPPVTALVDASILSKCADATIMVVAWGRTPSKVFAYALQQARRSGGRILGIVLSKVDVKQQANYGYGDSGRYHRDAIKYYSHSSPLSATDKASKQAGCTAGRPMICL